MRAARLLLLLAALVPGAAPSPASAASDRPLTVAVTLAPQAQIVKRLAPAGAVVVTMIPPGSSEEAFDPSPSQIAALESARLYFRVGHDGLPFEGKYVAPFLVRHREVRVVTLSDGVELAPIAHDEGDASTDGMTDPHLWMSPTIMLHAAERVATALVEIEPSGRDGVAARLATLRADIEEIATRLAHAAKSAPRAAFVAYHPTFTYLARDFGFRQIGVEVEGKELGLASLVRLTLAARDARARVLFVTPGPAERNARVLAESIGARVVTVDPLGEHWLESLGTIAGALAAPEAPGAVAVAR